MIFQTRLSHLVTRAYSYYETVLTLFVVLLNSGTIGRVYKFITMKCIICDEEIRGRYLTDFWHQTIHDSHKIEHCFSCGRFIKPNDIHLVDGRNICEFCSVSIVSLTQHINWVESRVRDILKVNGLEDIPEKIPVEIVSTSRMAELNHSSTADANHYGLTQTFQSSSLFMTQCSHTVSILNFLPKIFFAGVLAHEYLHVWQNEHKIHLSPPYCEGFCNLGSYVVYKSINVDLSRYYIKRLEEDANPVYGDGFRKVKKIYEGAGNLSQTMVVLKTKRM